MDNVGQSEMPINKYGFMMLVGGKIGLRSLDGVRNMDGHIEFCVVVEGK